MRRLGVRGSVQLIGIPEDLCVLRMQILNKAPD
jgi:hypothetical protein